jgi:TRAP-type C4-dicarboxylate transport system permease small subunit
MKFDKVGFPRAFRISGVLLVLGLCTEAISLHWVHPLAFIAFFVVGGTLLAAGVLLFLYSLLAIPSAPDTHDPEAH